MYKRQVFQFEHMGTTEGKYGKWTTKKPEMKKVRAVMNKWQNDLEGKAWNSLYWDNHDQPRAVSRFGDDSPMYREVSAKMIATCLHMLKGSPYIYQGEEIGMTNAYFKSCLLYTSVQDVSSFHGSVNDTAGSLTVTDVDDFHIVICESFQKLRIQLAFGSHSQTYESVIERKFVFSFASFYQE